MPSTYDTESAAVAALKADGFTLTPGAKFWSKAGRTDPFWGATPCLALVTVERRAVLPAYGGGEFFELKFH